MTTTVLKKPKTEYGHHWEDSFILEEVKITKVPYEIMKKNQLSMKIHIVRTFTYIYEYMW